MAVLDRSDLEASPLADLHAIADQLGLDGFRRLRKGDLIDAILGEPGDVRPPADVSDAAEDEEESDGSRGAARPRRRRPTRTRRPATSADSDDDDGRTSERTAPERPSREPRSRAGADSSEPGRVASGVVEVLGNGSAFLRVEPPEPSDQDVYISAAQVRRCELVSGDQVSGPVRTPRRSERYPSLVRIDTINGAPADTVSDGARYDDLAVDYPNERLALGSKDPTLEAIEWLTPLGRGSRAVIVGGRHAGKTETLRRLLEALHGREDLEVSVVLSGARPEEIAQWQEGPVAPAAALSFAASADSQDQAVERALDAARRLAARGSHALVLIDSLDGLHPHAARKALAAARNLREGGSLTVIATASAPLGGETTVIALDAALTSTGRQPILDLVNSGTLRPELLVGEDGAAAIRKARAEALEAAG
ncbi:MAG: transcription termination factor Rho [Solirubrobacterales bacterium]|nr:transcription termination factor Rho [Solirubrobacterales bacterium]